MKRLVSCLRRSLETEMDGTQVSCSRPLHTDKFEINSYIRDVILRASSCEISVTDLAGLFI